MEERKIKFPIAALLILYTALSNFINVFRNIGYVGKGITVMTLLSMLLTAVAFGALGVVLLMKRRDIVLVAALALPAAVGLIQLSFGMFLIYLTAAALAAVCTGVLPQLEQYRDLAKKFWFVPAAISALTNAIGFVRYLGSGLGVAILLGSVFGMLIGILAILLLCKWIVDPYASVQDIVEEGERFVGGDAASGYIPMVKHVLLMLFLGGIWLYVWIYKTTKFLNNAPEMEYRNPTTKLLLCMFVPFYYLYWVYQSAKRIDRISAEQGVPSDSATTNLILAIFIGIVPPILMQSKINAMSGMA